MSKMISYKFRLYPNKQQISKLWQHANEMNRLYNYFLNQRMVAYKKDKININKKHQQSELVNLKKNNSILNEIHSQVLQQVTHRLDKTYQSFFNRCNQGQGFPKFRSCKNFFGICYPQSGYKIDDNKIITKVYGALPFVKHRCITGNIKQITITTKNNKWFVCVVTDYEKETISKTNPIGIDVGITNIIATSDGKIIKNKRHAKYFDKQINKIKSRRDKQCKKYSRKWKRLTKTVQKLYDVKNRKINDFLHKVSKNLSSKYDTIICENLSAKKMSESKITGLNRELRNSQLANLISKIQYKSQNIVFVNPRNTSKTCNSCGNIQDTPLHIREYVCRCGYKEDRDINAAKNIFCLGQAILETRCSELTLQEALSFRKE
jgi:putative transposase